MSCIGNDVVDLQHPVNALKSRDSRYLKKILTAAEVDFVCDGEDPDIILWSLWACKETAYKVSSKFAVGAPFLPRLWPVQLSQPDNMSRAGTVFLHGGNKVFVRVFLAESYVHCIGSKNLSDLDKIVWGIDSLPQAEAGKIVDASLFVRECLCRRLAGIYHLDLREMEIARAGKGRELQPPRLYYGNKNAPFDISLSHDGQFVAYAFLKQ